MTKRILFLLTMTLGGLFLPTDVVRATQTENNVLHILPAPGPVKIDGTTNGWDLSGGIFACDDVERLRDLFSVWFFAMYDDQNLYLLTHFKDLTPLNNTQSSKGGYGFAGDCLQVRFITGYQTPDEHVSHWMGWLDRDKINVLSEQSDRDFKGPQLTNALNNGAKQAFKTDADGKGYVEEIAIPWKLLTKNGEPLHAGDSLRMAIEPNFTVMGLWGRLNIHDIFRAGVSLDRVFTFRAYEQWGEGRLEKSGHIETPPVRLSDDRQFPVKMGANGWPEVDWTGLIVKHELPGFKTISFDNPMAGDVSLNIFDSAGDTVRQLLTSNTYDKGPQEVKWDGLTAPHYKTPGNPVEPGTYTWAGLSHAPFKLTLRGWADDSGSTPWENGGTTGWGGDEGPPDAVATDGERMFLGWIWSEAGKGLLGTDLEGHVVWKAGSGLAIGNLALAVDGNILYSLTQDNNIVRLRTSDGVFDNWEGQASAALDESKIGADQPDAAAWPAKAQGMTVHDGKLYLSYSTQNFAASQLSDATGFLTKLAQDDPINARILALLTPPQVQTVKTLSGGKAPPAQVATFSKTIVAAVLPAMNKLLGATDLAPDTTSMVAAERKEANRKFLTDHFTGCFVVPKMNFIAVCDDKSGKLIKTITASYPGALGIVGNDKVGFISEGTSLMTVDPKSGETKPLITGLADASHFTTDADGKIYVSEAGTSQQVKIFTPDGQPCGTIGKAGGRQPLGLWQPEGMYNPTALAIDNKNKHLWVTETDLTPKRISVWNLADGKLVKDFYGATHYGASGGAIDPLDPNVMVGVGCEWKIDPATGQASVVGVFDRATGGYLGTPHNYAVFCPVNGKLYLTVLFQPNGFQTRTGLRIYERTSEGIYQPRAEWLTDSAKNTTWVWSDVNGDGKQDADEVTTLPYTMRLGGYYGWSANINPADFTIYPTVENFSSASAKPGKSNATVLRINPDGFTACGAPKWNLTAIENLDYTGNPSPFGASLLPSKDNKLLLEVGSGTLSCYDLAKRKQIWTYPNTFFGVQGSHQAPPPVVGLTRGIFGAIGTFHTPQFGTVWVMNGNCGEWYALNEKGYYLGTIFQGDAIKVHYPDQAVPGADMTESPCGMGGEDFGGSLTQAPDGKVYIEAGKTAFWNVELSGLDQVAAIKGGDIEIKPDDVQLAQKMKETEMQATVAGRLLNVPHATVTFTGNLAKDFGLAAIVNYDKGPETAIGSAVAWDSQKLYLGWNVTDARPWANGATDPAQMYLSGDTADFQFGSDPTAKPDRTAAVAGDFRLSIGNFQGKPTAELYRRVSEQKKPRTFSSGLIADYPMEYVDTVSSAQIMVTPRPDKKGYVIEASVPFSALGFTPQPNVKYHGDLGVTYGNEGASRTRLRVYWSNQETGLVDDAVYELMMTPKNWSDIVFMK